LVLVTTHLQRSARAHLPTVRHRERPGLVV